MKHIIQLSILVNSLSAVTTSSATSSNSRRDVSNGLAAIYAIRGRSAARAIAQIARSEPLSLGLLLIAASAALVWLAARVASTRGSLLVVTAAIILIGARHSTREDTAFLRLAGVRVLHVHLIDYAAIAAPFAVALAFSPVSLLAALPIFAAAIAPLLPVRRVHRVHRARWLGRRVNWVPALLFEWTAGLRSHTIWLLVIWTVVALFSGVAAVPLLGVIAVTYVVSSFFFVPAEGWQFLDVHRVSAREFLVRKVTRSIGMLGFVIAPLVALFLWQHTALWWALAGVVAASLVMHGGAVIFKYAMYRPERGIEIVGPLYLIVLLMSVAVPPLAAWLLWRSAKLAIASLELHCGHPTR